MWPSEHGQGKAGVSSIASGGSRTGLTPRLQAFDLQDHKRINCSGLKPPDLWAIVRVAKGENILKISVLVFVTF